MDGEGEERGEGPQEGTGEGEGWAFVISATTTTTASSRWRATATSKGLRVTLIKQAGNDDYNYDKGRYLSFSTRCSRAREKNLLIPAAAGSFSLDATLGLLATRRRLGRRGDSSAMRLLWSRIVWHEEFTKKKTLEFQKSKPKTRRTI